jgi:hypothetical protein
MSAMRMDNVTLVAQRAEPLMWDAVRESVTKGHRARAAHAW